MKLSRYRTQLMGFAALWIWMYHFWSIYQVSTLNLRGDFLYHFSLSGFTGVDIFILLSSFGLAFSFQKSPVRTMEEYGSYLMRRLSRLSPPFLVVTVALAVQRNFTFGEFLNAFFVFDDFLVNVHSYAWFVPCILLFYLFAPFYYNAFAKAEKKTLFTLGVCLGYFLIACSFHPLLKDVFEREDFYAVLTRVPIFLLGFLFAEYEKKGWHKATIAAVPLLLVLLPISIWLAGFDLSLSNVPYYGMLFSFLYAPTIVIALAWIFTFLEKIYCGGVIALFTAYGTMSYEFYLWQEYFTVSFKKFNVHNRAQAIEAFVYYSVLGLLLHFALSFLQRKKKGRLLDRRNHF